MALMKPAFIFLGSGLGGLLRFWLGEVIQNRMGTSFPLGTLFINVSGCFAMGFLAAGPVPIREEYRAAVLIGFLGGYTTFSTFGRESLTLVHAGEWSRAAWYIGGSVVFSLVTTWLGAVVASRFFGPVSP